MSEVLDILRGMFPPTSVPELLAFAVALGAGRVDGLTDAELALIQKAGGAPTKGKSVGSRA